MNILAYPHYDAVFPVSGTAFCIFPAFIGALGGLQGF